MVRKMLKSYLKEVQDLYGICFHDYRKYPFCGAVKRRTVHEMAKDEARHGKGFEGMLKRYFG